MSYSHPPNGAVLTTHSPRRRRSSSEAGLRSDLALGVQEVDEGLTARVRAPSGPLEPCVHCIFGLAVSLSLGLRCDSGAGLLRVRGVGYFRPGSRRGGEVSGLTACRADRRSPLSSDRSSRPRMGRLSISSHPQVSTRSQRRGTAGAPEGGRSAAPAHLSAARRWELRCRATGRATRTSHERTRRARFGTYSLYGHAAIRGACTDRVRTFSGRLHASGARPPVPPAARDSYTSGWPPRPRAAGRDMPATFFTQPPCTAQ